MLDKNKLDEKGKINDQKDCIKKTFSRREEEYSRKEWETKVGLAVKHDNSPLFQVRNDEVKEPNGLQC